MYSCFMARIMFDSVSERYKLLMLCCRSFEASCARLRSCFESLKPLFPESGSPMPMLDALVQQAFVGIDTITTVRLTAGLFPFQTGKP